MIYKSDNRALVAAKDRPKFSSGGQHPLLSVTQAHLIKLGFVLVPWHECPDFALIGCEIEPNQTFPLIELEILAYRSQEIPVILLSTSAACEFDIAKNSATWRAPLREQRSKELAAEVCLRSPAYTGYSNAATYAMVAERLFLRTNKSPIIIRTFEIFGEGVHAGLLHRYTEWAASRIPFPKETFQSGQPVALLHVDEYLDAVSHLLDAHINEALPYSLPKIYHVGGERYMTLGEFERAVWFNIWSKKEGISRSALSEVPEEILLPDLTNIKYDTEWRPKGYLPAHLEACF